MKCSVQGYAGFAGTAKKGKIETKTKVLFLHTDEFDLSAPIKQQVLDGKAIPLYNVYEVADNNTEPNIFEVDDFTMQTANAIKKLKAEMHISVCEQKELNKIDVVKYNKLIEITENNELLVVVDSVGKLVGQDITSIIFSTRGRTVSDKPSTTMVDITFADANQLENEGGIYSPTENFLKSIPRIFTLDENHIDGHAVNSMKVNRMCDCLTDDEFKALFDTLKGVDDAGVETPLTNISYEKTGFVSTINFDDVDAVKFVITDLINNGVYYNLVRNTNISLA